VPVVLVSARAGEESRVEGLDAGADNYLIKPFSARELLSRVNAQMERQRAEDVLREALGLKEKLLEVIPAGIYTCDAKGRITLFNHKAMELWGRVPKIGDSDQRFCGSTASTGRTGSLCPIMKCPWRSPSGRAGPAKTLRS
jgi:PAS domain-containing protein